MSERQTGRVRGFPAFPPGRRAPGRFARSWWGNAWIKAMRDTSLDEQPLRQGRKYAHAGRVGTITVSPGRIAAPVYGLDGTPYRTVVHVEQLTDAEWGRFLDQVAAKAGHIAALLDKDMPHDLVAAAEDAGVRLLPGLGDLEPECGCPGWEHPCEHAAALCFQASWLLDEDPFVLLLMRGRGRPELVGELQGRNAPRSPGTGQDQAARATSAGTEPDGRPPGTPAREAFARRPRPLPAPPPAPATGSAADGGVLSALPAAPGVDPAALRLLVVDAALRARELLTAPEPPPALDLWQDTVRMAATHGDAGLQARLRQATGQSGDQSGRHSEHRDVRRPGTDLPRAVRAWRYGGPAALELLEAPGEPMPADPRVAADLARARAALTRAHADGLWPADGPASGRDEPGGPPATRVWRNRWTVTGLGLQLRRGQDGRWHPYRREAGGWWPAGPPEHDPADALAVLLGG
jgi:uncharacterized Zn finger protein